MATLRIVLENVSATRCIAVSHPNGTCQFLRTRRMGTVWSCHLFEEDFIENGGPLMRLDECLALDDEGGQDGR